MYTGLICPDPVGEGHYKLGSGVRLSVCRLPRPNSRTERPRKLKIGRMENHHASNLLTYFEVKRLKVKVTRSRPINAVTLNDRRSAGHVQTASAKVLGGKLPGIECERF